MLAVIEQTLQNLKSCREVCRRIKETHQDLHKQKFLMLGLINKNLIGNNRPVKGASIPGAAGHHHYESASPARRRDSSMSSEDSVRPPASAGDAQRKAAGNILGAESKSTDDRLKDDKPLKKM